MQDYSIRNHTPKDKTELIELFNQFGDYLKRLDESDLDLLIIPEDYGERFYKKMLADVAEKNGEIYVLDYEGKIIGFVAGIIYEVGKLADEFDCKPHRMGRVIELFVQESYRGKGYGKQLLQQIENYFRSKDCLKMNLEVFAPNQNAYEFYKNYGFNERNIDLVKLL